MKDCKQIIETICSMKINGVWKRQHRRYIIPVDYSSSPIYLLKGERAATAAKREGWNLVGTWKA